MIHDIDNSEIEKKYAEFVEIAKSSSNGKKKALFFIYYSGSHGTLIDGYTVGHTVMNQQIDIEKKARKLAAYPNAYVIALFDCCRETGFLQTKGSYESVPEKVAGQLFVIHAVGPTKKVTRQATGVSPVRCWKRFSTKLIGC